MNPRIGHGFDVHRLEPGDGVVLGGVRIPCEFRVVAHSDGDVLIHALCDALLGAAGFGDIGRWFPDSDSRWKGADSRLFLREVRDKLVAANWRIANVDLTLLAVTPRVSAYVGTMCANLAADMRVQPDMVNIKATTTEELGFIGRKEGIAAHAVALLLR